MAVSSRCPILQAAILAAFHALNFEPVFAAFKPVGAVARGDPIVYRADAQRQEPA
ncbi:hypothetical protein ACIPQB_09040 [Caulobacter sp. LARHSG274]